MMSSVGANTQEVLDEKYFGVDICVGFFFYYYFYNKMIIISKALANNLSHLNFKILR